MRRLFTLVTTVAVALAMSGIASAQRHGGGRPATTGLEHAETKANAHGQRGIEKAEAKQADKQEDKAAKAQLKAYCRNHTKAECKQAKRNFKAEEKAENKKK